MQFSIRDHPNHLSTISLLIKNEIDHRNKTKQMSLPSRPTGALISAQKARYCTSHPISTAGISQQARRTCRPRAPALFHCVDGTPANAPGSLMRRRSAPGLEVRERRDVHTLPLPTNPSPQLVKTPLQDIPITNDEELEPEPEPEPKPCCSSLSSSSRRWRCRRSPLPKAR